jgi:hypothetical protein
MPRNIPDVRWFARIKNLKFHMINNNLNCLLNIRYMFLILIDISFYCDVHLSVRMKQLGFHWTDFHEICYLRIFRKPVEEIQVSLKSE